MHLAPPGFTVVTPRAPERRGGHVSLAHPEAWRICQALRAAGVVPDFRPPDVVRLAPVALYNSYTDCVAAVERLRHIVTARAFEKFPAARDSVT